MNMNSHFSRLILCMVVALLTGCSFTATPRVEDDFGQSVRQMVQEQIYDKQAASDPAVNGPNVLDGEFGDSTIKEYRKIEESDDEKGSVRVIF